MEGFNVGVLLRSTRLDVNRLHAFFAQPILDGIGEWPEMLTRQQKAKLFRIPAPKRSLRERMAVAGSGLILRPEDVAPEKPSGKPAKSTPKGLR